ncbi:MAG: pyridoxamine 5'-phosphate oxidase family protein [Proteobacteria bacterium]|nr:pyridoxamine 5'-phosphate oxidase family protein [Pseudomonadota bacterium]
MTTDQVWAELERQMFGVLGMVTARNEARTVGIVYKVRQRRLYFGTSATEWKVRHIAQNSAVSMTVPIAKRIPFLPWLRIPSATITFRAVARVLDPADVPGELTAALHEGLSNDPSETSPTAYVEITPRGEFVTYGVGVSLMTMRDTEKARGRAPVT